MAPPALALRSNVADLSDKAAADLAPLWAHADSALAVSEALHDVLPPLVSHYGPGAATLAAVWYDDLRDQREVRGYFEAIPADVPDSGEHALVGWALSEANDYPAFQTLILGGLQRRVADYSRLTVTGSSFADPQAQGWRRVGLGNCDFCRMLIGRGAVYSEQTADFRSHDHCQCGAEPAWR